MTVSSLLSRCQVARQVCEDCGTLDVCETVPTHNCTTTARENCQTREVTKPRKTCQPDTSDTSDTCVPVNKTVCQQDSEQHCHQVARVLTPSNCSTFRVISLSRFQPEFRNKFVTRLKDKFVSKFPAKEGRQIRKTKCGFRDTLIPT